jgi:hypothetical protein
MSTLLVLGVGTLPKLFSELTSDEAETIVQNLINTVEDEEELRFKLKRAGFEPDGADIDDIGDCGFKIRIWGPHDEVIDLQTQVLEFPELRADNDPEAEWEC